MFRFKTGYSARKYFLQFQTKGLLNARSLTIMALFLAIILTPLSAFAGARKWGGHVDIGGARETIDVGKTGIPYKLPLLVQGLGHSLCINTAAGGLNALFLELCRGPIGIAFEQIPPSDKAF